MELSTYFQPVSLDKIAYHEDEFTPNIGSVTRIYHQKDDFPGLENVQLALFGVCDDADPSTMQAARTVTTRYAVSSTAWRCRMNPFKWLIWVT